MTVDETNSYLVTGDADGVIKVWDIAEYCVACTTDNDSPPRESFSYLVFEVFTIKGTSFNRKPDFIGKYIHGYRQFTNS